MIARLLAVLAAMCFAVPVGHAAPPSEPPSYSAADPSAPAVTRASLGANERFWPYQVELVEAWRPAGRPDPIAAGTLAVLVRVEASGAARVDFGRDGLFEVPIEKTDLLARANAVRLGREKKLAPNLVHAIGPRLVDSQADPVSVVPIPATFEPPAFLCVFADPGAEGFSELAAGLSSLRDRHGVMTILVPQGTRPGLETRDALRALGWPVAFVMDRFAEGYTRSLLREGSTLPALVVLTREGRVLFESPWREGVVTELAATVDARFGGTPAPVANAARATAK